MNSLKLFPFMGMGDIPEGGDINELESGYYSAGNFKLWVNSPFSVGWGGIVVFNINHYTLQIASDMNTRILRVRHDLTSDQERGRKIKKFPDKGLITSDFIDNR